MALKRLKPEQVAMARRLHARKKRLVRAIEERYSIPALAKRFHASQTTMENAIYGREAYKELQHESR